MQCLCTSIHSPIINWLPQLSNDNGILVEYCIYCSLDQRKFARMFHCSKPAAANKKIKLMNKSFKQTIRNVF